MLGIIVDGRAASRLILTFALAVMLPSLAAAQSIARVQAMWDRKLDAIKVSTPDDSFDTLINRSGLVGRVPSTAMRTAGARL